MWIPQAAGDAEIVALQIAIESHTAKGNMYNEAPFSWVYYHFSQYVKV